MVWAYRGRLYSEWEQTAQVWAIIAEANRNHEKRKRPFSPHDLFKRPGVKTPPRSNALTPGAFRAMKGMFVKPRE